MQDLPAGWHKLTASQYFALPYLSRSQLLDFEKSERLFYKKHIKKEVKDYQSTSMILGSLVHDLTFEPDSIDLKWHIADLSNRRTNEYKQIKQEALPKGKLVVLRDEYLEAQRISESFLSHPWIERLISAGNFEVEKTGIFEVEDHVCKFKPDFINDDLILDLKTTNDCSPVNFGLSCIKYGYLMQAAWYLAGSQSIDKRPRNYFIVAVETEEPFELRIYEVSNAVLERELERIQKLLGQLSRAKKEGFGWKQSEPESVWVPSYYFEEVNNGYA